MDESQQRFVDCLGQYLAKVWGDDDSRLHGYAVLESPIEVLFYKSLVIASGLHGYTLHIQTQKQCGPYRVDFYIRYLAVPSFDSAAGWPLPAGAVIVECDGHEFHERTKEQAARDKKRDRSLQQQGHHVFRFTGRELWQDPFACALEVLRFLESKAPFTPLPAAEK